MVLHSQNEDLQAVITAVVSNHEHGGVRQRAERLGIRFIHFPPPWDAERYARIVERVGADWAALSGWLKRVFGLNPARTFNIHPALLSQFDGRFGGEGMYGHHVHEAVAEAHARGEITESGVTMHFVTDEYDRGPAFFEFRVPLRRGMTADEIAKAVNTAEHHMQPLITDLVVNKKIGLDGRDPKTLFVSADYGYPPLRMLQGMQPPKISHLA